MSETVTASIQVDDPGVWLQDPLAPKSAVKVGVRYGTQGGWLSGDSLAQATYTAKTDVITASGSRMPVAAYGLRQTASKIPLTVIAPIADLPAVHELLTTVGIVVLRGFHHPLLPAGAYLLPGDLSVKVLEGNEYATWTMTAQVVQQPSPVLAVAWFSWDDAAKAPSVVLPEGYTWDDVAALAGVDSITWADAPAWFEALGAGLP